jgi:hypothetical protein
MVADKPEGPFKDPRGIPLVYAADTENMGATHFHRRSCKVRASSYIPRSRGFRSLRRESNAASPRIYSRCFW